MARPCIENADGKIIHAAIVVASGEEPGVFSTDKIAALAGVSETLIYARFGSKDKLINACMMYLNGRFLNAFRDEAAKHPDSSRDAFNGFLNRMLASPEETRFALNYSEVFPRSEPQLHIGLYHRLMGEAFARYREFPSCQSLGQEAWVSTIAFLIRECIEDVNFLLAKQIKDTPENRDIMYRFIYQGLSSFVVLK